jgi:hypothetical protein
MKLVSQRYTEITTLRRKPGLLKGSKYHVQKREKFSSEVEKTVITARIKSTIKYTVNIKTGYQ